MKEGRNVRITIIAVSSYIPTPAGHGAAAVGTGHTEHAGFLNKMPINGRTESKTK